MTSDIEKLSRVLKASGYSLTHARVELLQRLREGNNLTVSQITSGLRTVDRASIYRNLKLFEKLKIANRLVKGFKHSFELSDLFSEHHHHIRCTSCGMIKDFESGNLERSIAECVKKLGYVRSSHSLEIDAICLKCQG